MRASIFLSFLLVLSACGDGEAADAGPVATDSGTSDGGATDAGADAVDAGGDDAGTSDGGGSDAGTSDAGTSDAGTSDAGTSDAGTDAGSDGGTAPDASTGCSRSIEDHVAGVCDGRGMAGCQMWARMNGGSTAVAQCVPPEGRCARADSCAGGTCTCGGDPECGDDQMCVSGFAGFTCVCLSP